MADFLKSFFGGEKKAPEAPVVEDAGMSSS
jgi:hypothetical protein